MSKTVKQLKEERVAAIDVEVRVLTRLISDYKGDLAELKKERTTLKAHIKRLETEPEKTEYVLLVETEHFEVDDRWIEDVVENLRAYAYPKVWGLQGMGKGKAPMFRAEFEIQASERSACEYLQDVKDNLLYVGIDDHVGEIKEVGS